MPLNSPSAWMGFPYTLFEPSRNRSILIGLRSNLRLAGIPGIFDKCLVRDPLGCKRAVWGKQVIFNARQSSLPEFVSGTVGFLDFL